MFLPIFAIRYLRVKNMTNEMFNKKWSNVNIDTLTFDQLVEYKSDCFALWESRGFLDKFNSPYDEDNHNGKPFKVLRRAEEGEVDIEAMPIWVVKFADGDTAYCYPEEICREAS